MRKSSVLLACALIIVSAGATANGQNHNLGVVPGLQGSHATAQAAPQQPGGRDGLGNNWAFNFFNGGEWYVFPPANGAALNDPPMFFPLSQTFAVDFSSDASVLYGLDFLPPRDPNNPLFGIGTVDLNTGDFNLTAQIGGDATGDFMSGLAIDPTNETFYICGASTLYTLDPNTGVAAIVNTFSAGFMIEIAFDCDGQMFAHSLSDESLYTVDKNTADVTLVGNHGVGNSNFAQGMDVDYATNTLYAPILLDPASLPPPNPVEVHYGTWDMTNGAFTEIILVNDFEIEMAIRSPASACPGGCAGDLNGDGRTDLADLGILLADFGCTTPPGPCVGDLNNDGNTDLADLGILLADFGCGVP